MSHHRSRSATLRDVYAWRGPPQHRLSRFPEAAESTLEFSVSGNSLVDEAPPVCFPPPPLSFSLFPFTSFVILSPARAASIYFNDRLIPFHHVRSARYRGPEERGEGEGGVAGRYAIGIISQNARVPRCFRCKDALASVKLFRNTDYVYPPEWVFIALGEARCHRYMPVSHSF